MSTTVELLAANERYERLRAAVEGLCDEWSGKPCADGDEGNCYCGLVDDLLDLLAEVTA